MEATGSKRKKVDSPRTDKNASTSSSRQNKTRKLDLLEVRQDSFTQIIPSGNEGTGKSSDLTQNLVSMWLGGSKGRESLLTQEVRESIALRESQQKCAEAESIIQKTREKVQNAEAHIRELTKEYNLEKRTNDDLIDKINSTAEMVSTITEHINYTVDTLARCRHHKDHLSSLYDNIILGQRGKLRKYQDMEDSLMKQITELRKELASLKEGSNSIRDAYENKINEKDAKLASVTAKCQEVQNQLEDLLKEKEEISRALSINHTYNDEFRKKILEYETQVTNLTSQLANVSANLDFVNEEKTKLQNELTFKNKEWCKLVEDVDNLRAKHVDEIAAMKMTNVELEEKFNGEFNERQSLAKMLKDTTDLKNELARQLEKFKDDTSVGMKEMEKRLENAQMENMQIRDESKRVVDEMEKRYESQVEKYELLIAEMKALDARHQSEISRFNESSDKTMASASADRTRLETQLDTLRREKEEQEIELRRVEDLLIKHTNSELQLQRKYEHCKKEATAIAAASAAAAAVYKRNQDAENQENVRKIGELEKELVKLQFDQLKHAENDEQRSQKVGENAQRDLEEKQREIFSLSNNRTFFFQSQKKGKEISPKKSSAVLTYQRSILKNSGTPRKSRASSATRLASSKKISFLEIEPDSSLVKFTDKTNITAFQNNENVYDEVIDMGKIHSQELSASQPKSQSLSQTQSGGKKFFKSRSSQQK